MAKILIVEDDQELAESLKIWLPTQGYHVEHVSSGKDALQLLENFRYDLVLLDWNLPDASGDDICKQYRRLGGTTQIIFVTGEGDIEHKQQGLDSGGDDYIVKPFDMRELAARIRSQLRRPSRLLPAGLEIAGVSIDPVGRVMIVNNNRVTLRPKEFALLEFLMRHPNVAFSSQVLLDSVWPSDHNATGDTIRSWVKNLREKLEAAGKPDFIKTVLGSGYMVEDATQS